MYPEKRPSEPFAPTDSSRGKIASLGYQCQSKKVAVKQLEESTTAVDGVVAEQVEQYSFKQIE